LVKKAWEKASKKELVGVGQTVMSNCQQVGGFLGVVVFVVEISIRTKEHVENKDRHGVRFWRLGWCSLKVVQHE
jgi:hypothetical protein